MPVFDAKALDQQGKSKEFVIEAGSTDEVVEGLRSIGLFPVEVNQTQKTSGAVTLADLGVRLEGRVELVGKADAKIQELDARFAGGDDSAFDELRTLLNIVVSEQGSYPRSFLSVCKIRLHQLEKAGSAEAWREQVRAQRELMERISAGDPEATDQANLIEIAPGWLQDGAMELFGELRLGPNGTLIFLERDEASGKPKAVHSLCTPAEFESIRVHGLFKKTVVLRARGGKSWTIRPDRRRFCVGHRALIRKALPRIISYEGEQAR